MRKNLLALLALLTVASGTSSAHPNLNIACDDKRYLTAQYEQKVGDFLRGTFGPGVVVKCTSCYRDKEKQADTCEDICGKAGRTRGCQRPPRCAPPGHSQHQKPIATCDLYKIPGETKAVCAALKTLCDKEFHGKCGVGGYGGGGFHFGVGDTRFSAWNQCGGLVGASKEAQDLSRQYEQAETALYDDFLKIFINTTPVLQQIIQNSKAESAPAPKQQ